MKRKILVALLLVALVGIVGGNFAYFFSNGTPINNVFHAALYKVSATDEQLKFNKKIKNYLKNRGLDISDDVSVKEICRQINNSKMKIVDKDLLIKDIELRSQNFDSRETSKEKLEKLKFDNNIKEIMNASQNKMIELFCHFHKDNN